MAHHLGRRRHQALDDVVGDVQQAGQKQLVAGDALGHIRIAVTGWRCIFQHKTALGADGHDDRVFDLLRLDQAQNFGAEVFAAVGPAQAAARYLATAQMHTFHTWRIDPDLKQRLGLGHAGDFTRVELEAHVRLVATGRGGLPDVGAQGGLHGGQKLAKDAVFVQAGNVTQSGFNRLHLLLLQGSPVTHQGGVEPEHKQVGKGLRDQRVFVQGRFNVALAEGKTQLLEIAGVSAQHGNAAAVQGRSQRQLVQVIAFDVSRPSL